MMEILEKKRTQSVEVQGTLLPEDHPSNCCRIFWRGVAGSSINYEKQKRHQRYLKARTPEKQDVEEKNIKAITSCLFITSPQGSALRVA